MNTVKNREISTIGLHRFHKESKIEQIKIISEISDRELERIVKSDFDFLGKHLFIAQGERKGIVEKGKYFSMYS